MKRARRFLTAVSVAGLMGSVLVTAPAGATFPGDNGKLLFVAAPPPAVGQPPAYDIYVSDGASNVTNLTNSPEVNDGYASWSPDGSKIAFVSDRDSGDGTTNLFYMNANGTGVTPLPPLSGDQGWTAWSPDGSKIAFSTDNSSISYVNLSTGDVVQDLAVGWHPNWSPDGSTIAYINQVGDQTDIFKVPASGGSPTNLTNSSSAWEFAPNYSPDGSKILFSSDESSGFETVDLYTMTSSGGSKTRVTSATGWESEPSWSPDGTKIVYTYNTNPMGGGNSVLYTANADGSSPTPSASVSGRSIDHPDWQPLGNDGGELTEVSRNITLKAVAKGTKLILKGKVTSAVEACNVGQAVAVQKLKSGAFKTLAVVYSNDSGGYKKAVKKANGKYRAVASASQTSTHACLEATSKTVKFPS